MKCAIRAALLLFLVPPAAVLAQKSGSDLDGTISPAYEASPPSAVEGVVVADRLRPRHSAAAPFHG
jgi:hypothetical protein